MVDMVRRCERYKILRYSFSIDSRRKFLQILYFLSSDKNPFGRVQYDSSFLWRKHQLKPNKLERIMSHVVINMLIPNPIPIRSNSYNFFSRTSKSSMGFEYLWITHHRVWIHGLCVGVESSYFSASWIGIFPSWLYLFYCNWTMLSIQCWRPSS